MGIWSKILSHGTGYTEPDGVLLFRLGEKGSLVLVPLRSWASISARLALLTGVRGEDLAFVVPPHDRGLWPGYDFARPLLVRAEDANTDLECLELSQLAGRINFPVRLDTPHGQVLLDAEAEMHTGWLAGQFALMNLPCTLAHEGTVLDMNKTLARSGINAHDTLVLTPLEQDRDKPATYTVPGEPSRHLLFTLNGQLVLVGMDGDWEPVMQRLADLTGAKPQDIELVAPAGSVLWPGREVRRPLQVVTKVKVKVDDPPPPYHRPDCLPLTLDTDAGPIRYEAAPSTPVAFIQQTLRELNIEVSITASVAVAGNGEARGKLKRDATLLDTGVSAGTVLCFRTTSGEGDILHGGGDSEERRSPTSVDGLVDSLAATPAGEPDADTAETTIMVKTLTGKSQAFSFPHPPTWGEFRVTVGDHWGMPPRSFPIVTREGEHWGDDRLMRECGVGDGDTVFLMLTIGGRRTRHCG